MVCVPCIVIPFVLWFFHKYIQPYISKMWNPWKKVEGPQDGGGDSSAELKCPLRLGKDSSAQQNGDMSKSMANGSAEVTSGGDKKRD
ncbi:hypothetical protein V1264_001829 [Littorina saxatilis]|uniref:Uncharacterized protein n=1 Tax=Littorina saxatilis TaxID=31220 RepID=A0AAN9C2G8_9CAEN